MKTNISQIDYDENLDSNEKWWKWTEICDECGKQYQTIMTMKKPNTEEKDYCIDCLRKKCDNQGV